MALFHGVIHWFCLMTTPYLSSNSSAITQWRGHWCRTSHSRVMSYWSTTRSTTAGFGNGFAYTSYLSLVLSMASAALLSTLCWQLPFCAKLYVGVRGGHLLLGGQTESAWGFTANCRSVAIFKNSWTCLSLFNVLVPGYQHLLISFFVDFTAASARSLDCGEHIAWLMFYTQKIRKLLRNKFWSPSDHLMYRTTIKLNRRFILLIRSTWVSCPSKLKYSQKYVAFIHKLQNSWICSNRLFAGWWRNIGSVVVKANRVLNFYENFQYSVVVWKPVGLQGAQ